MVCFTKNTMKTFTNTAEGRMLALITGCAGLCMGLLKNVGVGVSLNPFEVNFRKKMLSAFSLQNSNFSRICSVCRN